MGIAVGLIFSLLRVFINTNALTLLFGGWVLLFSESFSEVQFHDILHGDVSKYHMLRWKLKIIRLVSYFVTILLFLLFIFLVTAAGILPQSVTLKFVR